MSIQTVSQQTLPGRPLTISVDDRPGKPNWAGASKFGYIIILLFFGGLGGWASFAPLASGVNVSGTIEVDSGTKTVQHLEGGLVEQILVSDGDRVSKGEVVIRMDRLRTEAQSIVQRSSLISLLVERARLLAEIAGDDAVSLDSELLQALDHPIFGKIIESELELFDERKDNLERQLEIRHGQIAQIETQIRSLGIRLKSTEESLALIDEELASVQQLYDKRLTTKSRLLAVKRARTGLLGQVGIIHEALAETQQKIAERQLTIEAGYQARRTANVGRLNDLGPEVAHRREASEVLAAQIGRIEVKAPVDGRVMNMQIKTLGQVVGGGQVLMQIIPDSETMVVQGKLKSKDIDQVKIGAMVKVRLRAFNPRLTPPVDGQVVSITPTTVPAAKGRPMYGVTVKLDSQSLKWAIGDQQLTSGMPASGMIAVGEQTLMSYLLTPMIASFELAMREP
jgi:HlyD family type I secretion membrane fusion protein